MAHIPRGPQLPEHAGDHVLRHCRRPDGPHHERRHHHVAAEVGGEVGKAGHELLAGAEQLHPAHLPLQPPGVGAAGAVAVRAREKFQKGGSKDLLSGERRQRRGVGGDSDSQLDGGAGPGLERDDSTLEPALHPARIDAQLQHQPITPVEGWALYPHSRGRSGGLGDGRQPAAS